LEIKYGDSTQATLAFKTSTGSLGFVRFGRVHRIHATQGTREFVDVTYSYDKVHNPTAIDDGGPLAGGMMDQAVDYGFTYDDMGRLIGFERKKNGGTVEDETAWELTGVGNWRRVQVDDQQGGGFADKDERQHNEQNEIVDRKFGSSQVAVDPDDDDNPPKDYDIEGNLLQIGTDDAAQLSHHFSLVYDAWNRLVVVKNGDEVARYERDGMGRIIAKETSSEYFQYYYTTSWQLITVVQDDPDVSSDEEVAKEYIWGTRYIDELVGTVTDGTRRYHIQDANWNVVATITSAAAPQELVVYEPYGKPKYYNWVMYLGGQDIYSANSGVKSTYGTDVLFQGRWYDALEDSSLELRLYHFRHRAYAPVLGRFLQRDPLGNWWDEVNVGNAYSLEGNNTIIRSDPDGLSQKHYTNSDIKDSMTVVHDHEMLPDQYRLVLDFCCLAPAPRTPLDCVIELGADFIGRTFLLS
jgi:RHS repeat-associated protein